MTWTKLGSEFLTDPGLSSVPRGARLLHVEALVWSNQHGTDGFIPRHMLTRITDESTPEAAADELVAAGRWDKTDDGWTVVDFIGPQPSAADVKRTQEKAAFRQRKQRQHRGGDHSLCEPKYCPHARDATRESRVTHGVSHDTRTDTDPSRKSEGSVDDELGPLEAEPRRFNCSMCEDTGFALDPIDKRPLERCTHNQETTSA